MSVRSAISSVSYVGNNSSELAYVVPFKFFEDAHLEVKTVHRESGVETVLSPGVGFTVTGKGDDDGGTVKTSEAVTAAHDVVITRNTPPLNLFEWSDAANWRGATLEANFDWAVMATMDLQRRFENLEAYDLAEAADTANQAAQLALFNAQAAGVSAVDAALSADAAENARVIAISGYRPWLYGYGLAFRSFRLAAEAGFDTAWTYFGDSTFADSAAIPSVHAAYCAATYTGHRVEFRKAANDMQSVTTAVLRAGPLGRRYRQWPSGALWATAMPMSAARVSPDGATHLRFEVEIEYAAGALSAGVVNTTEHFILGYGTSGNMCRFTLSGSSSGFDPGKLSVQVTTDGGAGAAGFVTTVDIPLFTPGVPVRFRADLVADNGSNRTGDFYYSLDSGASWTKIGETYTGTPTTFGIEAEAGFWLGGSTSVTRDNFKIYHAQIGVGSAFDPILPERLDLWKHGSGQGLNASVLGGSPTIFIDQCAQPGATLRAGGFYTGTGAGDFLAEAYRALINHAPVGCTFSNGHNDSDIGEAEMDALRDTAIANLTGRYGRKPGIVLITQNPEPSDYAPGSLGFQHNAGQAATILYCDSRGYDCVDTFTPLREANNPLHRIANNVHPTGAGYAFQAAIYISASRIGASS